MTDITTELRCLPKLNVFKILIGLCLLCLSSIASSNHKIEDPLKAISGLWVVGEDYYCIYGCDEHKPDFSIDVGRLLKFSDQGADNGEEFCQNVHYQLRYIDRDLWLMGNDHLKETMDIKEKHLATVTVHCNGESLWNTFGTWICILDHNTILISHYGYIIQATRI
ncbi:hypothetical protein A9Q77_03925 [Marinomonas sp. 42_23_T18]|nr:hypothetical protein A9Q77_03925 [Marinomonas sp. 42_23_T18]